MIKNAGKRIIIIPTAAKPSPSAIPTRMLIIQPKNGVKINIVIKPQSMSFLFILFFRLTITPKETPTSTTKHAISIALVILSLLLYIGFYLFGRKEYRNVPKKRKNKLLPILPYLFVTLRE